MLQFKYSDKLSDFLKKEKAKGRSVGFVPTMGALHDGHLSLIKQALSDCDLVVCSIFVNPTQFNNSNDLSNYPVDLEKDLEKLSSVGCSVVFIPSIEEMYPKDLTTISLELDRVDTYLEGEHRPGHFAGVVTVVNKFFNLIQPDKAYFGQKDYQQYRIIKLMADQLNKNVEVVMCPTMRENDGLAMSSRNRLLSAKQRRKAPLIYRALSNAAKHSSTKDIEELLQQIKMELQQDSEIRPDYIEIADIDTLQPIKQWEGRKEVQAFVAAFLGEIRLIDNITLIRD